MRTEKIAKPALVILMVVVAFNLIYITSTGYVRAEISQIALMIFLYFIFILYGDFRTKTKELETSNKILMLASILNFLVVLIPYAPIEWFPNIELSTSMFHTTTVLGLVVLLIVTSISILTYSRIHSKK